MIKVNKLVWTKSNANLTLVIKNFAEKKVHFNFVYETIVYIGYEIVNVFRQ